MNYRNENSLGDHAVYYSDIRELRENLDWEQKVSLGEICKDPRLGVRLVD